MKKITALAAAAAILLAASCSSEPEPADCDQIDEGQQRIDCLMDNLEESGSLTTIRAGLFQEEL